ncbi:MAG: chlorophyllase/cutinase-like alpha/beta fold protein [Planctomycetota bacterium]
MRFNTKVLFYIFISVATAVPGLFAQGSLVPTLPWFLSQPGPYATASADWNHGNVNVTNPLGGGTVSVQHFGVVWYPTSGGGQILQNPTPFPFIVFAHGRFQQSGFIGTNHKQATYLLQHLASWGFVVSSVNLDVVGQYTTVAAIPQRGELINQTVSYFMGLAPYAAATDFNRIIYIGHSRGGEGVFAAVQQNPAWLSQIKAIAAIAPTNFQSYKISRNAFVIYGSQDGDVNNGWPIQLYDNTLKDQIKGFRWIEGANHFYFTDSISFALELNAQLTRAQHHEISKTYFTTWAMAMMYNDRPALQRIAGDKEILWSSAFKIHRIFSHPRRITVDDFEQTPANPLRNSLGGTNTLTGLTGAAEANINTSTHSSYFHVTKGLIGTWTVPAQYNTDLLNDLDVTGYPYVSVNLLQKYNSAQNPFNQPKSFHISIRDAAGNSATYINTDVNPWPYPFNASPNGPVKSVFKSFRFPVSAFTAQNPNIDLTKLRKVVVDFDVNATGEFALDDVVLTQ